MVNAKPPEREMPVAEEPRTPSDQELIDRLEDGDERAFEALCERYAMDLERRVGAQLPDVLQRKVAVSDVLQDAYMVALRHLAEKGFEEQGDGSFGRWLGRIVDLKVREALRHYLGTQKRTVARERSLESGEVRREPAHPTSPSQVAMAKELGDAVRIAWRKLSAEHREVLGLIQDEGLTLADAGERIGRTAEATRKLYARALARFTRLLEELRGNGDSR
jgi:RNA polymerase sigma-70 factor (ECF subfamily)